jgi:small-conductance mechanosensitive channel
MRKLMMAVTAVAGLAMVSGCKRDNVESERRDVAEAQQEAQQETAEARQNAQEDIAGARQTEQEEIAGAQQDVLEEEKDVAEAQRTQQEELAQNQREQQDEMVEDQRELREDTAQGGSGMVGTSAAATSVQGRVLSTGGDSLTLVDTSNNKQLKLKTDKQTRIMQNNAPVKLDDITEGTQVRASYVMDGKNMVARELTVTQPVQEKQ